MTGDRNLVLITPNVEYNVHLRNKYTILLGNGASGKTAFRDFMLETTSIQSVYDEDSNLESDFDRIVVVDSDLDLEVALGLDNTLCIIDEDFSYSVRKHLEGIRKSNNFFLIISREVQINLSYGIYDVIEFRTERLGNGKYRTFSCPYAEFTQSVIDPDLCIIEDSSSGYNFYKNTLNVKCVSAKFKTRVPKLVSKNLNKTLLVIIDEVGFGYEFYIIYRKLLESDINTVYFWCPYSFEYILLNSGLFQKFNNNIDNPYSSCDFSRYSTVEVFIEKYLTSVLKDIGYEYSKSSNVFNIKGMSILNVYLRNFDNFENLLRDKYKEV